MGGKNVDKFTRRKSNHCAWCGKPTAMEAMQLPETPILEFMEEKIKIKRKMLKLEISSKES